MDSWFQAGFGKHWKDVVEEIEEEDLVEDWIGKGSVQFVGMLKGVGMV